MKVLETFLVLTLLQLFCVYTQSLKFEGVEKMSIDLGDSVPSPSSSYSTHRFFRHLKALSSNPQSSKYRGSDRLTDFKWENCASEASEKAVITSLKVLPDPLKFPGNVSLQFDVTIKETLNAPLSVAVKLEKHESFFWLPIPCIDDVGSCTYDDICKKLQNQTCPPNFKEHNIPCKCPFPKGSYSLPLVSKKVSIADIPSGEYRVTANVKMNNELVTCTEIHFNVA